MSGDCNTRRNQELTFTGRYELRIFSFGKASIITNDINDGDGWQREPVTGRYDTPVAGKVVYPGVITRRDDIIRGCERPVGTGARGGAAIVPQLFWRFFFPSSRRNSCARRGNRARKASGSMGISRLWCARCCLIPEPAIGEVIAIRIT